jgi:hypothetical protein
LTYIYVFALSALIIVGLYRSFFGDLGALPVNQESLNQITENGSLLTGVTLFALLRAFSSGADALSGVEAISNGVPAFRAPEPRNAARTLVDVGNPGRHVLRRSCWRTACARGVGERTLLRSWARPCSGRALLLRPAVLDVRDLILAANTGARLPPAVVDHRRTASSSPAANRGDRLVFSNGVLVLAGSRRCSSSCSAARPRP